MEYMIFAYSDEQQRLDFAPGSPEFQEMMGAWMRFNQELIESGAFISGGGLASTDTATTLTRQADGAESITDGPYAETKEQLGGYYVVEAPDLDAALAIARKIPIPAASFEVRPIQFRPDASTGDPQGG
ncbi:MAG: YciI family protein [Actinomycetota bacterium]